MKKDKPHYLNHRARLKERFMKAPHAASDTDIVELLLSYAIPRKDVKQQAKDLLDSAKSMSGLFDVNLHEIKGLGSGTEILFTLLKEFLTRSEYQKIIKKTITCSNTEDVFKFLKHKIGRSKKEVFIIILLDSKNRIIEYKIVREGFVNSVSMSPRDIIEYAISKNALSVIIAHNHPSGDCSPSDSDFTITYNICHALLYTGITLLDHLIVCVDDYYSMNTQGYIKKCYDELKSNNNP